MVACKAIVLVLVCYAVSLQLTKASPTYNGTAQLTKFLRQYEKRYYVSQEDNSIEADGVEYDAHQNGKYWERSQCPKLGSTISGMSLHSCMQRCTSNHKCTAIHYKSDSNHCELVNCPIPPWRGYSLDSYDVDGIEYEAYQPGKYFAESQCPKLGASSKVSSLKVCMRQCTRNHECTAVNYKDESVRSCELRKCPIPAPQPSGTNSAWIGYANDPNANAFRSDHRCANPKTGKKFLAPNGRPAVCNERCCSEHGWCGDGYDGEGVSYCTCPKCIDYSGSGAFRSDHRCSNPKAGINLKAPNGRPAVCNERCCSEHGWCGDGYDGEGVSYCNCPKCIDYYG